MINAEEWKLVEWYFFWNGGIVGGVFALAGMIWLWPANEWSMLVIFGTICFIVPIAMTIGVLISVVSWRILNRRLTDLRSQDTPTSPD